MRRARGLCGGVGGGGESGYDVKNGDDGLVVCSETTKGMTNIYPGRGIHHHRRRRADTVRDEGGTREKSHAASAKN